MSELLSEDAEQGAWVAGWLDGIRAEARSLRGNAAASVEPMDGDAQYGEGFSRGAEDARRVAPRVFPRLAETAGSVHDSETFMNEPTDRDSSVAPTEASAAPVRRGFAARSREFAVRAAASVVVIAGVWFGLAGVERAAKAMFAPADSTTPISEETSDERLFQIILGDTSESDRLAALRVLLTRAEKGRVDGGRKEALVDLVRTSTSPEVALEAAGVVRLIG